MLIVAGNVAVLLIFALAGWILCKARILNSREAKILSVIEVWVILPCKSFEAFSKNFTAEYLSSHYILLIVSAAVLACLLVVNRFLAPLLSREGYERSVTYYSLTIPNYGYAGYALAESIYGPQMLLNAIMFGLPMSIWIYVEGYRILTKAGKASLRRIINPPVIGLIIGCVFGLACLPVPSVISRVVSQSSACMAPISMLLLGITIADYDLSEILKNGRAYLITAMRLLVIPMALALILSRFLPKELVLVAVLLYSMPCGLNTVVFPRLVGEDCRLGAALSLISSVLAILTVPLCLQLVELLC